MHAIQHRGQDGVGVAVSDRENVVCKKGLGLLSENLKQDTLILWRVILRLVNFVWPQKMILN